MKSQAALSLPLLASVAWIAALVANPEPLSSHATLLVGIGLLGVTGVAVVGMLIVGGRWAQRLALVAFAGMVGVAAARPIDVWWVVAFAATVLTTIALLLPVTTAHLRQLPPATPVPVRAVLLPLGLVAFPYLLGLALWGSQSWASVLLGISAQLAALWYSRVFAGGLFVVRVAWPFLALALAPPQGGLPAVVSVVAALACLTLSWHSSVKMAFHPPQESGTTYAIPPELTPGEVLDSANLDERGIQQ